MHTPAVPTILWQLPGIYYLGISKGSTTRPVKMPDKLSMWQGRIRTRHRLVLKRAVDRRAGRQLENRGCDKYMATRRVSLRPIYSSLF